MKEHEIKKNSRFIKLMAFVVFAFIAYFAINTKPKLPEELSRHMRQFPFKTYGGYNADTGWSVIEAGRSGFVIAGETASYGAGSTDAYLIKTDKNGDVEWTRTFGGDKNDAFISVIKDGKNLIAAGGTASESAGETDMYVVKTDENGDVIWEKKFGGRNYDYGYSVIKTSDNNILCAGYTSSFNKMNNSDAYLVKISPEGGLVWENTYSTPGWDVFYSVVETPDSGFAAVGYTTDTDNKKMDLFFVRTDSKGRTLWKKKYGGNRDDEGVTVINTKDKGFLIAGKSSSYTARGFGWDIILIKTDAKGTQKWMKVFPAADVDAGTHVVETRDGYIVAGTKKCYGICDANIYLFSVDKKGSLIDYRIFAGKSEEKLNGMALCSDGGVALTGYTLSYGYGRGDIFLTKISNKFEKIW